MNSFLDLHTVPMTHSADTLFSKDTLNNQLSNDHLSDDQIDDHLIGDLATEPALHLAACSVCTERVAAALLPIANFDAATLAWSERRSATLPVPDLSGQRPVWQRQMAWVTASFALAIGIALSTVSRDIQTAALQPAPRAFAPVSAPQLPLTETAAVASPAPAQVSADNQMLKAINDELEASAETPADLGLDPGSIHPARSLATISVQD
jgi:hypothetical protein